MQSVPPDSLVLMEEFKFRVMNKRDRVSPVDFQI